MRPESRTAAIPKYILDFLFIYTHCILVQAEKHLD